MSSVILIAFLKFGGYATLSYTILKLANAIKEFGKEDAEPELNEIVKKPRLRR